MSAVLQRKIDGAGPGAVEVLAVEGFCGKEGASLQTVENVGKTSLYKECESISLSCKSESENILRDAEKEKQEGTQGQWQQESLAKEFLEQV